MKDLEETPPTINEDLAVNPYLYCKIMENDKGYFECQLPILAETEKAICFDASTSWLASHHKPRWIPKSQIVIIEFRPDSGIRYFVKNWLYRKLNH